MNLKHSILKITFVASSFVAYATAYDALQYGQESLRSDEGAKPSLTLTLPSGLRNRNGQVCMSLFDQDTGFPIQEEKAISAICVSAADFDEKKEMILDSISYVTYAIALFHDENMDKKLNTGIFGIPTEGFAFSNNPGLRIGAPSFQDCAITFNENLTSHRIEMRYLR